MASRFFQTYRRLMQERPYMMHAVQTASLMGLGDVISQHIAVTPKTTNNAHTGVEMDYFRTAKFGSIGLLLGPMLTKWYFTLERLNSRNLKVTLVKKVLTDQLVFAPFAVIFITTAKSLTDGKSFKEVQNKLQKDFFTILLTNYKIWPLVQFINFSLVPVNYRVLVIQTVAVGWNVYLSMKLNSKETESVGHSIPL